MAGCDRNMSITAVAQTLGQYKRRNRKRQASNPKNDRQSRAVDLLCCKLRAGRTLHLLDALMLRLSGRLSITFRPFGEVVSHNHVGAGSIYPLATGAMVSSRSQASVAGGCRMNGFRAPSLHANHPFRLFGCAVRDLDIVERRAAIESIVIAPSIIMMIVITVIIITIRVCDAGMRG